MPAALTPTIAWLRPDQLPLLRAVATQAGLHVIGAGSPDPTHTTEVARGLDAEPMHDLRGAIATASDGVVLIAAAGAFGARGKEGRESSRLDAEELDAASERGVRVLSLEPIPASLQQLAEAGYRAPARDALGESSGAEAERRGEPWCECVPLTRHTRAAVEARELLATFGPVRAMIVRCVGSPAEGSLGSRLLDAMDLVALFLGEAEQVHAAHTAASVGRGVHQVPPAETLRFLHGDIAASLRFTENRAASVFASNQAGAYNTGVTLIGPGGRVEIDHGTVRWINHDDHVTRNDAPSDAAGIIATQIAARLAMPSAPLSPNGSIRFPRVMAMAHAAILSTRTGEPESPGTMLNMSGA